MKHQFNSRKLNDTTNVVFHQDGSEARISDDLVGSLEGLLSKHAALARASVTSSRMQITAQGESC